MCASVRLVYDVEPGARQCIPMQSVKDASRHGSKTSQSINDHGILKKIA